MRRDKVRTTWFTPKRQSIFDANDYRSCNFKGDWQKHYFKDIVKEAVYKNKRLYAVLINDKCSCFEHRPAKLYKFYPFNINSIKGLTGKKIYLNTPSNFNDPYDCYLQTSKQDFEKKFYLDTIKKKGLIEDGTIGEEEYRRLVNSVCYGTIERENYRSEEFYSVLNQIKIDRDFPQELEDISREANDLYEKGIRKIQDNRMRVSSFAALTQEQVCTYTEMWGHYADSHRGFCVEYDFSDFYKKLDAKFLTEEEAVVMNSLMKCRYGSKPNLIAPTIFYKNTCNKSRMTPREKILLEKEIVESFVCKSSAWSYEHEWRIVIPEEISSVWNNFIPFPYASKVFLGAKMSEDDRAFMYRICEELDIEVLNGYLREDNYKLEFYKRDIEDYFI